MNSIGEGREGGGGRGGFDFLGPPLQNLLGHFLEITIIYLKFSAQAQSMGTLFE